MGVYAGRVSLPAKRRMPMAMIYRNYKDNVFCLLYRDRENLLELYNALNGTQYKNSGDLTVMTLPGTICIQYKNDAAFAFGRELYLCEQQATENPNMPLRFLHYISEEYRRIVPERDLYRQNAVKIPSPHFVIFYNGVVPQPERQVYKLSDLYEGGKGEPELEIRAVMLNINRGNNRELLEKCRTLREYMQFVEKVRSLQKELGIEAAVRQAVEECIGENILRDFLKEHREEVIGMSIWEFKEDLYREAMQLDALENGRSEGLRQGLEQGLRQGLEQGLRQGLEQGLLRSRVEMVCRKLKKGKAAAQIAEEMEESEEELKVLIDLARRFAPEYDADRIIQEMELEKA